MQRSNPLEVRVGLEYFWAHTFTYTEARSYINRVLYAYGEVCTPYIKYEPHLEGGNRADYSDTRRAGKCNEEGIR